jgi:hypothetical protein
MSGAELELFELQVEIARDRWMKSVGMPSHSEVRASECRVDGRCIWHPHRPVLGLYDPKRPFDPAKGFEQ